MAKRNIGLLYAVLLSILIFAPQAGAYPVFVMKLLCFALFASAFNLLLGYTGLLSFGHAAFFGGAAYITGHVVKVWGVNPEVGLLAGILIGAMLGWLFGVLAIRRQGIYFAMITLALAQLVYFLALQAKFTGGEDGLQGVGRGKAFGFLDLQSDLTMYYFTLTIVTLAFVMIWRIVSSPFGHVLKGIKENEPRAISLGYDVDKFKLLAFVLSAALAGLAGSLKTLILGFATLTDVHWSSSGSVILMTLLGGLGMLSGPLAGATVIVVLENKLGELGDLLASMLHMEWPKVLGESISTVTGILFITCVLFFRRGIVGEIQKLLEEYLRQKGIQQNPSLNAREKP